MSLRTLVDTDDHTAHGAHIVLRQGEVKKIMVEVPQMTTVVSDKKRWTVSRVASLFRKSPNITSQRRRLIPLDISMEHINTRSKTPKLWFMSTN